MELAKLAEYHLWANNRVREMLKSLTDEEYTREIIPPFGSIKNLVIHSVLAAEYNIKTRVECQTVEPHDVWEQISDMNLPETLAHWQKVDNMLVDFSSTHLDLETVFPNFLGEGEMPVDHDDFFMQYMVHTAYHRSQIMSAMRMLGKEGVGTDYLFYLSYLYNISRI
jgi:uncharacterized damage-inducible protein DinB